MSRDNLIQFRKGTLSQFNSANPTLASGEPGFAVDANVLKVGDGITPWSGLLGFSVGSGISALNGLTSSSLVIEGGHNIQVSTSGTEVISVAYTGLDHIDVSTISDETNSNNTFIQNLLFDQYGHVTGVDSVAVTGIGGSVPANVLVSGSNISLLLNDIGYDTVPKYILEASGSSHYLFSGPGLSASTADPTLYLVRGRTYKFVNNMGAHPFQFQTSAGIGGTAYTSGMDNSPISNATMTWEIRHDTPNTLYYQCTSHSSMQGTVYVLDKDSHPDISAVSNSNNNGDFFIQNLLFDQYGHVTGVLSSESATGIIDSALNTQIQSGDNIVLVYDSGTGVDPTGTLTINVTGVVELGDNISLLTNDAGYATTGELVSVSGYLQGRIDSIPSDTNTFVSGIVYNTGLRDLVLTRNDGVQLTGNFDIVLHSGDNISLLTNDSAYDSIPEYTLSSPGLGNANYRFNGPGLSSGVDDPTLYLYRGKTYKFVNSMGAHPFQFQTTAGLGGTAYTDGIAGSPVSNGTLTWEIEHDTPNILYYQCTSHSNMQGVVYVLDKDSHPAISTASSVDNSNNTFIQDLLFDQYGHVTGVTSIAVTGIESVPSDVLVSGDNISLLTNDAGYATTGELSSVSGYLQGQISALPSDTNTFVSGIVYNTGSRDLVLTRNDGVLLTGNLSDVLHSGDSISLLNNNLGYITGFTETISSGDPISFLVNDVPYAVSGTHIAITNAASNVNNTDDDFIQDLLFDEFGHITGVVSAKASSGVVNSALNTQVQAGENILLIYDSGTGSDPTGTLTINVTGIIDGGATVNHLPVFSNTVTPLVNSIIHQSGNTLGINTPALGINYTIHAKNLGSYGSWIVNENAEGNSPKNTVFEARESGVRLGAMYSYGTAYSGGSIAAVGSGGTAFTNMTGPVAVGPLDANKPLILGGGINRYATIYASEFRINPNGLNQDFIVYGTGDNPLIYTDADSGTGRVGIGRIPDNYVVDISGSTRISPLSTATKILTVNNTSGTTAFEVEPNSVYTRLPLGVNITGSVNTAYGIEVYDTGIMSTGTFFFAAGNGIDAVGAYVKNINPSGDSFYALGIDGGAVNWVLMNDARGRGTEDTFVLMKGNIASDDVKLAVTASGNVGIGTDSPSTKLEVANSGNTTIRANNTASNIINILNVDSDKGYIGTITDHDLRIGTNSTARIIVSNSGNVGIGVDPDVFLSGMPSHHPSFVIGDGNGHTSQTIYSASNSAGVIYFADGTTTDGHSRGYIGYYHNAGLDRMQFATSNIARMFIDSAGNVGIGAFTPQTKLDVSGIITATSGNSTQWNTAYGWGDHSQAAYLTGHPIISAANTSANSGNVFIQNLTLDSNGHITAIDVAIPTGVGGGGSGISNLLEDLDPRLGGNLDLNNKNIDGAGDIDIDGAINAEELTISSSDPYIYQRSTDSTETVKTYHYDTGSQLGGLLSYGKSSSEFTSFNTLLGLGAGSFHLFSSYGHLGINTYGVAKDIVFGTDNTERARITSGGNIGIGTDSPATALHIVASSGEGTVVSRTVDADSWAGLLVRNSQNQNVASFQYGNSGVSYTPSLQNTLIVGSRQSGVPVKFYQGAELDGAFRHNNERIIFDTSGNTTLTAASGQFVNVSGNTVRLIDQYSKLEQRSTDSTKAAYHYFYSNDLLQGGLLAYGAGYGAGSIMDMPSGSLHLLSNYEALAISTFGVNKPIVFGTNANSTGGERMRIAGDGRVGIGTNNPASKLDVRNGDILVGTKLLVGSGVYSQTSPGAYFGLKHTSLTGPSEYMIMSAGTHTYLSAKEDSDVIIRGGGNKVDHQVVVSESGVTIGKYRPAASSVVAEHDVELVYDDGGCVRVADRGGSGVMIGDCAYSLGDTYAGMKHTHYTGVQDYMMISQGYSTLVSSKSGYSTYLRAGGNDSTYQTVIGSDAWGIGFNANRLRVNSQSVLVNNGTGNYDFKVYGHNNATQLIHADAALNRVGIGTATPATKLDVNGVIAASGGTSAEWNAGYSIAAQAFGWGNHASVGYLTVETDPVFLAHTVYNIANGTGFLKNDGAGTWTYDNSTYLTSETSHSDVLVDGDFSSQGIMLRGGSAGTYTILTDNSSNWNNAFGWGDHSGAGYLTSIAGITVSNFAASTIVTESEDIASNDNDTTIPTSAAVKDYVDNNGGGGAGGSGNLVRGSEVVTATTGIFDVSEGYSVGTLDVYQNGIKLFEGASYDYTATNGTSFNLTNPANSGDLIEYLGLNTSTNAVGNTSLGTITVTSNQDVFNTSDTFTSSNLAVFLNGVKLVDGTDYNVTSSSQFTLTSTAVSGDVVEYIAYGATVASSNLSKTGDTMTGNLTVNADLIVTGYKETHTDNGNTGTAQTIDISDSTLQTYTLNGNCTFTMPTADAGRSFTMFLKTGAGSLTATFTGVKFPDNVAPTISTTANRMDILTFYSDGTNWYGSAQQEYHV